MEFCKQFNAQTQKLEKGLPIAGRDHGVQRPQLHLHHEDAAGVGADPQGDRHREGQRHARTPPRWARSRASSSRTSPRSRCRTSRPRISTPPCAPSPAAPAAWASTWRASEHAATSPKRMKAWKDKLPPGKQYPIDDALEARQGIRHRQVQRVGRRRGEPRHRRQQVGPAGARLDRDAARHRQDGARGGVHQRQEPGAAEAAGADIVGLEDLAEKVKAGEINFDVVIASPDAMRVVGQLGQILGPRGLMPNPKVGTVTPDVAGAVKNAKAGPGPLPRRQGRHRALPIGRASFEVRQAEGESPGADRGPAEGQAGGVEGRVHLEAVTLSSTMGPGVVVDQSTLGL